MKKIWLAGSILLAAILTFFDPFKLGLYLDESGFFNFFMIAVMLVIYYFRHDKISEIKLSKIEGFFAVLLGFCMALGYGLMKGNRFSGIYGNPFVTVFFLASFAFYAHFAISLFKFFFAVGGAWLEKDDILSEKYQNKFFPRICKGIENNNFKFYFAVFLLAWLIPFAVNFPGHVMFDTRNQVNMYYHIQNHHTDASVLLNESQYITQHHSIPHTLLTGIMFDIGKNVFGTFEAGIFLFCLVQYIAMAAMVACMFKAVKPYFGLKWTLLLLALFALHPFFAQGSFLMTKDIYFSGVFILYILKYYELIRKPELLKKIGFLFEFFAITVLLLLLRNNALYSVLLTSLVLFFALKQKLMIIVYTLLIVVFNTLYTSVLLPAFDISEGSVREALSIPFQQTAYYVNEFGEEVTEEEKAAISKILDYNAVKNDYDPELSDYVKDTYNKYATTDDLVNYFKIWGGMFVKHPWAYVEAFILQNYGYYYPGVKIPAAYHVYNSYAARLSMVEDGLPYLNAERPNYLQNIYFNIQNIFAYLPFVCLLADTGAYIWIWIMILLFVFRFSKQKAKYVKYYIPFFAYILFILVGPANGTIYMRYIIPFAYTVPFTLLPMFELKKDRKK